MKSFYVLGLALVLGGCHAEAHATTANDAAQPGAASDRAMEHAGWEKLGERDVAGQVEREGIDVGRADGRFSHVMIEVKNAPIELFDMVITFGDGERYEPKTRLVFDTNTRSRQIDLPGGNRIIKRVDFKMSGLAGGTHAHVELFGH